MSTIQKCAGRADYFVLSLLSSRHGEIGCHPLRHVSGLRSPRRTMNEIRPRLMHPAHNVGKGQGKPFAPAVDRPGGPPDNVPDGCGAEVARFQREASILGYWGHFMRVGAALLITSISFTSLMPGSRGSSERRPSTTPAAPILASTEEGVRYGYLRTGSGSPSPTLFVFALSLEASLTHPIYNRCCRQLLEHGFLCVSLDLLGHGRDVRPGEPEGLKGWSHRVPEGAYRHATQWLLRQASQIEEEKVNER